MYKVENKEGYILLDREKKTEKYFSNWYSLVYHIASFSHSCGHPEFITCNSILCDLNVTGNDVANKTERIVNPKPKYSWNYYIYNHYTGLRRYMIIRETGEGIVVSELLKDVYRFVYLKCKAEAEKQKRVEAWCEANKGILPSYRLTVYGYDYRKRKYLKSRDSGFRRDPVSWTGHHHRWCGERGPKLKNRMLSNIDAETGYVYGSKYKIENLDLWDGRGRYHDKSWKTSTKCRKQWEKHLDKHIDHMSLNELYSNFMESDLEFCFENE